MYRVPWHRKNRTSRLFIILFFWQGCLWGRLRLCGMRRSTGRFATTNPWGTPERTRQFCPDPGGLLSTVPMISPGGFFFAKQTWSRTRGHRGCVRGLWAWLGRGVPFFLGCRRWHRLSRAPVSTGSQQVIGESGRFWFLRRQRCHQARLPATGNRR